MRNKVLLLTLATSGIFFGPDDPAPNDPNPNPAPNPAPTQTQTQMFTQQQVNDLIANNRRSLQDKNNALVKQLQELQNATNTTQEQKDALQQQIEALQNEFTTKEQQQTQQYQQLEKKYDTDKNKWKMEAATWRGRFEQTLMQNDILRACGQDVINEEQILALLLPKAKPVEELEGGQPTGNFTTQVEFMGIDQETKKPVKLKLSPADAIKAMREMPDRYGNLFKTKANGGLGDTTTPNPAGNGNAAAYNDDMSMEDYAKNREAILAAAKR